MAEIVLREYVTISEIPLATPAFLIPDVSALYDGPDMRGENKILPHVVGTKALPRRITEMRRTLNIYIFGEADLDGDPFEDARIGMETNIAYLRENLFMPPASPDGTRPAVLHFASGATKSADVQVIGPMHLGAANAMQTRGSFDIIVPAGVWI